MISAIEVQDIQETKLAERSQSLQERVRTLRIVDQPTYDEGAELVKGIKGVRKEIKAHHQPILDRQRDALEVARAAFASLDNPLAALEKALKEKLVSFAEEQERLRRIEQKRFEELARKEAEEAALALASEMVENGASVEEAEQLLEEVVSSPAPYVTAPGGYQKAAGISKPIERWSAEVIDLRALVSAWLAGDKRVPADAILANEVTLNRLARAMTSSFDVPGVRANNKPSLAIRA